MTKNNLIAGSFLALGCALVWLLDRSVDRATSAERVLGTEITGEQIQLRLQSCIAPRLNLINLVSQGWRSGQEIEQNWQTAARSSFGILPGMQALSYVTPAQVISQVYPLAGNESARNANLSQHPNPDVRAAIARAANNDALHRTPPIELLQSGLGFAVYKAMRDNEGQLLGFVNGVFRINELISTCLAELDLRDQYVYQILDSGGAPIYEQSASTDRGSWENISRHEVDVAGTPWILELAPYPINRTGLALLAENLWLAVGLLLVLLLALTIRAWLNNLDNLQESHSRYQLLVENQSDLIIKLGPEGRFLYVSPSFCRFVQKSEAELLGRNFMLIVSEDEQDYARTEFMTLSPENRTTALTQRLQIAGEWHWLSWLGSVVLDDSGEIDCIVAVGRDITEQRNMEAQVAHSQKMRAVGELAGGISHDFNNLLQVILANIELLLAKPEDLNQSGRLENIRSAVSSGIELTSRLSTLSKQESSRLETIDAIALIQEAVSLIDKSLPASIALQATLPAGVIRIRGNKSQLERVLFNLCFNARDAIDGQGDISIAVEHRDLDEEFCNLHEDLQPGEYLRIQVCDNGKGIPEDVLPRIFEPFFSTKIKSKGTGLGLANCYSIISQHGGIIQASSTAGKGSCFEFFLPVLESPDSRTEKSGAAEHTGKNKPGIALGAHGRRRKALVADDNPELLATVKTFLELEQFDVLTAKDGRQAVELFTAQSNSIDLVILDMMMPDLNGKQAAELILQQEPETRLVFMSGYFPDDDSNKALNDLPLLRKPFTRKELLDCIELLLAD